MLPAEAMRQAVEHEKKTGKWPSRRFRVEQSAAGSSHLLTRHQAEVTKARYGGVLVQVIGERPAHTTREQSCKDAAQGLGLCPVCAAPANQACRKGWLFGSDSSFRMPHVARIREAKARA